MRKLYIAIMLGSLISGIGFISGLFADFGKCFSNPDILGLISYYLALCHVQPYTTLFDFETRYYALNLLILFLIPTLHWSIISYVLLQVLSFFRRNKST
jgi:hypothetical protein